MSNGDLANQKSICFSTESMTASTPKLENGHGRRIVESRRSAGAIAVIGLDCAGCFSCQSPRQTPCHALSPPPLSCVLIRLQQLRLSKTGLVSGCCRFFCPGFGSSGLSAASPPASVLPCLVIPRSNGFTTKSRHRQCPPAASSLIVLLVERPSYSSSSCDPPY